MDSRFRGNDSVMAAWLAVLLAWLRLDGTLGQIHGHKELGVGFDFFQSALE